MERKISVLVLDDQSDFRAGLEERLGAEDINVILTTGNPRHALETIKNEQPDIVIFDVILSQIDGIAFLKEALKLQNKKTHFIAASTVASGVIVREVMRMGADYFLIKPIDFDILHERILQICEHYENVSEDITSEHPPTPVNDYFEDDLEKQVTSIILEIGIPAHVKGYHYVRSAIILAIESPDVINAVTKIIYPTIAKKYQTSSSRVERAIRHAIEVAWDRGNVDTLNTIFGYSISSTRGKPTNSEFIAMISDRLRLKNKSNSKIPTYKMYN